MTCPIDKKIDTDIKSPTATVVWQQPRATDFFGNLSGATCSPPSGSLFHIGHSNVMCETFDSVGSSKTCHFEVNVEGMFGMFSLKLSFNHL